jgi:hypothetical protein
MAMFKDGDYLLPFFINETDLLAPTIQYLVSPCDGFITEMYTVVQKTITTGGTIKVTLGSTDVVGDGAGSLLLVTHADSDAAGTVDSSQATFGSTTRAVTKGQAIKITPSAGYATAGAVNGWLRITGGK